MNLSDILPLAGTWTGRLTRHTFHEGRDPRSKAEECGDFYDFLKLPNGRLRPGEPPRPDDRPERDEHQPEGAYVPPYSGVHKY